MQGPFYTCFSVWLLHGVLFLGVMAISKILIVLRLIRKIILFNMSMRFSLYLVYTLVPLGGLQAFQVLLEGYSRSPKLGVKMPFRPSKPELLYLLQEKIQMSLIHAFGLSLYVCHKAWGKQIESSTIIY